MSHAGEIDCHCNNGGLVPPPAIAGVDASSRVAGDSGVEGMVVQRWCHCGGRSQHNKNSTKLLNTMYLADMIVFFLHL